jgi:hypothetical protein
MGKTTIFPVINNRFLFRCASCGAKRRLSVSQQVRQKNVRCHKCQEITKCAFNRRITPRESQTGKVILVTSSGKEVDVTLTDASSKGIGLELSIKALRSRAVKVGDTVQIVCNWNPALFSGSNFIVKNIREQRVGIKKIIPGEIV